MFNVTIGAKRFEIILKDDDGRYFVAKSDMTGEKESGLEKDGIFVKVIFSEKDEKGGEFLQRVSRIIDSYNCELA